MVVIHISGFLCLHTRCSINCRGDQISRLQGMVFAGLGVTISCHSQPLGVHRFVSNADYLLEE
ncbi:hypothetical protein HanIR_Chr17g0882871 [Helianthus annuus]|nr:hypothetical protein HanIR_Chr17g0882871 [Helianthus annuus]